MEKGCLPSIYVFYCFTYRNSGSFVTNQNVFNEQMKSENEANGNIIKPPKSVEPPRHNKDQGV